MAKNNSQRAKLALKARENLLTKDVANDFYLTVKPQRTLSLADLAREVAATHGHQNATEIEMLTREVLELAAWYLSCGFGITTPLGYYHTTVSGSLLDSELNAAPDRSRIKLGVAYAMSELVRQSLADANAGITLTRRDKANSTPIFIPATRLFPNTPTQVGFVMPAGAEEGSVWQVKLCTQLGNNGLQLLKEPRTVTMDNDFVMGQPTPDTPAYGLHPLR